MLNSITDPEILSAFRQSVSVPGITAGFTGLLFGAAAFVSLAVPGVARVVLPKPQESLLSDNLPFDRVLEDGKTIVCRDGTLCQMVEVAGKDTTFFSATERDTFTQARKNWIDSLAESGVSIRTYMLRDKVPVYTEHEIEEEPLRSMAAKWNSTFQESFRNRQVILISKAGRGKKLMAQLDDAIQSTLSFLDTYDATVMNQNSDDSDMRPLSVLGRIISPVTRPTPAGMGGSVSEALTADHVFFGGEDGLIKFSSGSEDIYCRPLGFRRLGDYTDENFATELSGVQCEMVVLNNIEPLSRAKATLVVGQDKRMKLSANFTFSAAEQFVEAEELIEGNGEVAACLTYYNQTIFLYADSPEKLDDYERDVKRIANSYGMTPVNEGMAGHAAWFSQFPGFRSWPRQYKLFSYNIANQITLDRPPEGLPRSDWGEGPIAYFRTSTGSAYQFQFHVSTDTAAVAHAVTIGPTGGGKTTIVTFLAAMAMRHKKLRTYIIDRFGGAYIFTNAMKGKYAVFDGADLKGTHSALNPFQMPNTKENKAFLRNFLQALADVDDADSLEEISFAVDTMYDIPGLPKAERSLVNVFDAVFSKSKPVRKKLERWIDPSMLGDLFNAPSDTLDLTTNRLVTLDFTKIYENDDVARAVILYLMHRIQASITELKSPALIFIDETEPVVQHPMFRKFFLQMLQEYRKKGSAIISAFQRPEAISQAGLGEAIRGQAQTTFFLQNPQAQEEEYADWSLTDREWDYVKGRLPQARRMRRSMLVKRATGESVILDVDLGPLGEYLRIFRSDETSKAVAERMMDEHSAEWLTHYLNYGGNP